MRSMRYSSEDDRRRLVPATLVLVLGVLLDELEDAPDYRRAELKTMQRKLRIMYDLPMPEVNETEVSQYLAEEDGIPVEP